MQFHARLGQDRYLFDNFFRGKRNGVFVDIGAGDGEKFSNSLFYERTMDWSGLCVEHAPSAFAKLSQSRRVICERVCIAPFDGQADIVDAATQETSTVPVTRLGPLLERHGLTAIDYCSIDAGNMTLGILTDLDFGRFRIDVLMVNTDGNEDAIVQFMATKGYTPVARPQHQLIFSRAGVKRLPQTSVICAAWHKEPNLDELLRGHAANLSAQTVPVEVIYVFDGGAEPPAWLKGRAISVREPLTIYQSWNVALSLVDTPFVMNLNLDDRLCPDAVQFLENTLRGHENAVIIGGEWKICYSRDETDSIGPCYSPDSLTHRAEYPPQPGVGRRLGSGTGEVNSLGPARMWRMSAHINVPRYPWQFSDGTRIRTIADGIFQRLAPAQTNKKALQVPMVIGNYHSHPSDQAEFRHPVEVERPLLEKLGVPLM